VCGLWCIFAANTGGVMKKPGVFYDQSVRPYQSTRPDSVKKYRDSKIVVRLGFSKIEFERLQEVYGPDVISALRKTIWRDVLIQEATR
jgi:hypothetical protein